MKTSIVLIALLLALTSPRSQAGRWQIVKSPDVGTGNNLLASVSAAADNDVWAVGSFFRSQLAADQTLIEHFNGTRWSVVTSPNTGAMANILYGVAVTASNDVWAVGTALTSANTDNTLIEHWNGTAWSIVPSPNVGNATENVLSGVGVISANDVWAVGHVRVNDEFFLLTLHWNGTAWSIVPALPGDDELQLLAVGGVASNDVWAVGAGVDDLTPLALHWDGTQWTQVQTPITFIPSGLYALAPLSSDNVWTIGPNGRVNTLELDWNGTQFVQATSPHISHNDTYPALFGIVALAADDIWSVGAIVNGSLTQPFSEQWNGSSWQIVATPTTANANTVLSSVTATPDGTLWAVGNTTPAGAAERTFILRMTSAPR